MPPHFRTRRGGPGQTVSDLQEGVSQREEILGRQPVVSYGNPTSTKATDYTAKLGECVIANPDNGAMTITLPKVYNKDAGASVSVKNYSDSTQIITLTPLGGRATIDKASTSITSLEAMGAIIIMVVTEDEWAIMSGKGAVVSGAAVPEWTYMGLTRPAGISSGPQFYYQFDSETGYGDDKAGNCPSVGMLAGRSPAWTRYSPTLIGWGTRSGTGYFTTSPTTSSTYQNIGAMTLEILVSSDVSQISVPKATLVRCSNGDNDPGGTANNWCYALQLLVGSDLYGLIMSRHHNSAQVAQQTYPGTITEGMMMITQTRNATGDCLFYFQGKPCSWRSLANLNTPYGGSNGYLEFGRNFHGTYFCSRMWTEQFTDAQVWESYQRTRGIIT